MNNYEIGLVGQGKVLQKYLDEGYFLVAENYESRYKYKQGEIDLILFKDNVLVLVEVKTRLNNRFGRALEQITKTKIQNMLKTYRYFISRHENQQYLKCASRIDLAGVEGDQVAVIKNAVWL